MESIDCVLFSVMICWCWCVFLCVAFIINLFCLCFMLLWFDVLGLLFLFCCVCSIVCVVCDCLSWLVFVLLCVLVCSVLL